MLAQSSRCRHLTPEKDVFDEISNDQSIIFITDVNRRCTGLFSYVGLVELLYLNRQLICVGNCFAADYETAAGPLAIEMVTIADGQENRDPGHELAAKFSKSSWQQRWSSWK